MTERTINPAAGRGDDRKRHPARHPAHGRSQLVLVRHLGGRLPRGRLLLPRLDAAHLQPHGDHTRQGQPQGRRHGPGGIQRPGRIPEPPQRGQRGLHPPVAPPDVGGRAAARTHDRLLGARQASDPRPLRAVAPPRALHRRDRGSLGRTDRHAAARRAAAPLGFRRRVPPQVRTAHADRRRVGRHGGDAGGKGRRRADPLPHARIRGRARSASASGRSARRRAPTATP